MTQSVSIADLMTQSGVAFGTSGARGLVSAMTDRVCFAYTCAFLQHLSTIGQFAPGTHIAIAGDLRPSSPRIMAASAAAVRHMGGTVDYCGSSNRPPVEPAKSIVHNGCHAYAGYRVVYAVDSS